MKSVLAFVVARAKEPSTWAATGVIAVGVHMVAPGALGDSILAVLASAGALLGVVLPEVKA